MAAKDPAAGAHALRMARDCVGDLAMVVTKNGQAWVDDVNDGAVNEGVRVFVLQTHIASVRISICTGANAERFFIGI